MGVTIGDRARRAAMGLAVVLGAAFAASLIVLPIGGLDDATAAGGALYAVIGLLATALLVLRALAVDEERGTWLAFAAMTLLNVVATVMWAAGYDWDALSPADAVWSASVVAAFVGIALYLRHRVGDAYRSLWLDATGITVYVAAICTALLVGAMRDEGLSSASATLNVLYPCASAAMWSVVLAAGSMTGRRLQRQDALLGGSFVVLCATDCLYALELAGFVGSQDALRAIGVELSIVLLVAAAWARPSAAGPLRIGGWWEAGPTVSWIVAGGGVLLASALVDVPSVAVGLAAGALALAALRTVLVTRDVRQLVLHRREALTDDLTGLPNRRALLRHLELLTRDRGRGRRRAALLLADLDGFKELNDALGHAAGDVLLTEVAGRLAAAGGTFTARLGGDEFAAIVEAPQDPREVARRMLAALAEPLTLDDITVGVGASIGIARYPDDATTSGELVRRADVAMYDAKRNRTGVADYTPERDGFSRTRVALAAALQDALPDPAAGGLWVAFQPQVRFSDGRVDAAEALIRWTHPVYGAIAPAELLPLAERIGGLGRLTDWIVDEALAAAATWRAAGHEARVAVNVSATTLIDTGLPARIVAALARHGMPGERLVIEVTENAVMTDPVRCCGVLDALAAHGIGVSIDDFGTGQSSLAQLRRIGAGELKIDRSFVMGMLGDRFDREVVTAVAGLGRRLGMRLVAEGVEDRAAWEALAGIGCDLAQGYGIARPMALDQLLGFLARAREAGLRATRPVAARSMA